MTRSSLTVVAAAAAGMALLLSGCGRDSGGQTYLEAGLARLRRGEYEGAARQLERAARKAPENATAYCNLGIVCWKLGRKERALEALRIAADLDPKDPRPLQFLGQILIGMEQWNEARETLKRLNDIAPDSPWVLTSLAVIAYHAGEASNTQLLLIKALDADPAYPPALYNLAVLNRDRLGKPAAAAEYFRKYLEQAPGESRAAKARAAIGELIQPAPQTNAPAGVKAQDRSRADADRRGSPRPPPPVATGRAGETAAQRTADADRKPEDRAVAPGRDAPVERRAPAATNVAPVPPKDEGTRRMTERPPATAQESWSEAQKSHMAGDWDGAISGYKRTLELDRRFSNAAYNLGLVYKTKGMLPQARDAFLQTLSLKPNMLEANYMLAAVYRDLREGRKAEEQAKRTLRIKPDYAAAHLLLGLIYREQRNDEMARLHFSQAIQYAPDAPFAARARQWLESTQPPSGGRGGR